MRDNNKEITMSIPSWVAVIGKSGPWVLLCFLLIYQLFIQRDRSIDLLSSQVTANGKTIELVNSKMDTASLVMSKFASTRETKDEAIVQLLLRLCIQTSTTSIDRQSCLNASEGKK